MALQARLQALRHAHQALVLSSHQTPIGLGLLLESLVMRGARGRVVGFMDQLTALNGVRHAVPNLIAPATSLELVASTARVLRHASAV
jgi:CopG family transcriptional regulator, nickel-responsive regulator